MLLSELPEELLQEILERIEKPHLSSLSLASKWGYLVATPLIWREVELMDCQTSHEDCSDEHDDTPIIRKLLILATKPRLAASVHTLIHRCHLPPPAIFSELPCNPFSSQTLSADPRTIRLVQHAVNHMTHVHTLRIILGHPNLTDALLRCFFDSYRAIPGSGCYPVRKLWLENCRISAGLNTAITSHPYWLPLALDFSGLESVRFRRLPIRPGTPMDWRGAGFVYSRGGRGRELQDGTGKQFITTVNDFNEEARAGSEHLVWLENRRIYHPLNGEPVADLGPSPLQLLFEKALRWDDWTYMARLDHVPLPSDVQELSSLSYYDRSVMAYRGQSIDGLIDTSESDNLRIRAYRATQREVVPSATATIKMLRSAGATLTSLTLDWILSAPQSLLTTPDRSVTMSWIDMYHCLLQCRFPQLRAFQFRNCVVGDTLLPREFFLLDHSYRMMSNAGGFHLVRNGYDAYPSSAPMAGLEFMEAHPKLQCLAWPMDHIFAPGELSPDIAARVEAVIENLGRNLVDLRVDSLYHGAGETMSEARECPDHSARGSRWNFITRFAPKMLKLESIKAEGGMPRDERREIIRALHQCPLKKIVMIGVCNTLGNTWGPDGADIARLVMDSDVEELEAEDKTAIFAIGHTKPQPPPPDFKFNLEHGWEGAAPMLHTIASFHSETVRELKFCGYKGAPVLFSPTPITTPILASLKHFHNLESIIMSMYLTTQYEGSLRDSEIISYWLNSRTPTSTALVHITDEEPEGWEKELRTKFAPDALAWRVTNFVGEFLSEKAKARQGGVHVRASFCIGDNGGLYDVDLWVGKGVLGSDVCLGFKGPREEFESDRRKGKLGRRRWF